MSGATLTWLILGALALSVLAVVLDRVNFPQRPFRPRGLDVEKGDVARDRTGAHIIEETGPVPVVERRRPGGEPT